MAEQLQAKDTVTVENTAEVSSATFTNPDREHMDVTLEPGETGEVFFFQAVKSDRVEIQDDVAIPDEFDPESGEPVFYDEPESEGDSDDGSSSDGQGEDDESHDFDRVFKDLPHLNEDDNLEELQEKFEDSEDFFENVEEDQLTDFHGVGDSKATDIMAQLEG